MATFNIITFYTLSSHRREPSAPSLPKPETQEPFVLWTYESGSEVGLTICSENRKSTSQILDFGNLDSFVSQLEQSSVNFRTSLSSLLGVLNSFFSKREVDYQPASLSQWALRADESGIWGWLQRSRILDNLIEICTKKLDNDTTRSRSVFIRFSSNFNMFRSSVSYCV